MTTHIHGLCSMATKRLLADLSDTLRRSRSLVVRFESAGGVEVARKIRGGVRADMAVLGEEQMLDLDAGDLFVAGTLRPLFVSEVVAAVAAGAPSAALTTEADLRAALVGARRVAYSTGPSGSAFLDLVGRWELTDVVRPKLVQAVPGSPVGTLLADGEADLGFQQRSELSGVAGARVLGPLPGAAAIHSTFSGAVLARSTNAESAREVLSFLGSQDAEADVTVAGMVLAPG